MTFDIVFLPLLTPAAVERKRFYLPSFVFFRAISQKTDAAKITELHVEIFHDESWKLIYFRSKGQGSRSRVTKTLPASVFVLL